MLLKKTTLIILSVMFLSNLSYLANAQNMKFHEIKVNTLDLGYGIITSDIEKGINEKESIGIEILYNTKSKDAPRANNNYSFQKLALTAYYRFYFSKKPSSGFFIENSINLYRSIPRRDEHYSAFGVGISIGQKFIFKKGITGELMIGLRRDVTQPEKGTINLFERFRVAIGKRF